MHPAGHPVHPQTTHQCSHSLNSTQSPKSKVQAVTSEGVLIMTAQNSKDSGVAFTCISNTYLHDFMKPTKSSSVRCPKTHWHHIMSYVFGSGEKSWRPATLTRTYHRTSVQGTIKLGRKCKSFNTPVLWCFVRYRNMDIVDIFPCDPNLRSSCERHNTYMNIKTQIALRYGPHRKLAGPSLAWAQASKC